MNTQNNNELRITLIKAEGIILKDNKDTCDPFVKFYIGSEKRKSQSKKRTISPVWNEKIESFKSFDLMHSLKISLKDSTGGITSKNETIGIGYLKLEQLPESYPVNKKINIFYSDEANTKSVPTGSVYLQLEAINFGIHRIIYQQNVFVNRYVKAFHSEKDPMSQCIVLSEGGQFFLSLEEAISCLKMLVHKNSSVNPLLILFPGDYMVRETIDLDIKDLVLFGITCNENITISKSKENQETDSYSPVATSGIVKIHPFYKGKPIFNIKRQCFLHKLNLLGSIGIKNAGQHSDETCYIDSSSVLNPIAQLSKSAMKIKYINYDLSSAIED
jgi:hypothetical protein